MANQRRQRDLEAFQIVAFGVGRLVGRTRARAEDQGPSCALLFSLSNQPGGEGRKGVRRLANRPCSLLSLLALALFLAWHSCVLCVPPLLPFSYNHVCVCQDTSCVARPRLASPRLPAPSSALSALHSASCVLRFALVSASARWTQSSDRRAPRLRRGRALS